MFWVRFSHLLPSAFAIKYRNIRMFFGTLIFPPYKLQTCWVIIRRIFSIPVEESAKNLETFGIRTTLMQVFALCEFYMLPYNRQICMHIHSNGNQNSSSIIRSPMTDKNKYKCKWQTLKGEEELIKINNNKNNVHTEYAEFNEKLLIFPFVAHFYRFFFFQLFAISTDKYQLLAMHSWNIYTRTHTSAHTHKYAHISTPTHKCVHQCTDTPSKRHRHILAFFCLILRKKRWFRWFTATIHFYGTWRLYFFLILHLDYNLLCFFRFFCS